MDDKLLICFALILILFLLYNNGNGFSVGGTKCTDGLNELCLSDKKVSADNCLICAGEHEPVLYQDGCTSNDFISWCKSTIPPPTPPPPPPPTPSIDMQLGLSGTSAVVNKDNIYIIGGRSGSGVRDVSDTIYVYNIDGGKMDPPINMPYALTETSAVVNNDKIYIIGGNSFKMPDGPYSDKIYVYNIDEKIMETTINMPKGLYGASAVVNKDVIYIIGGVDAVSLNRDIIYVYNISTNAFTTIDMPLGLSYTSAVVNRDNIYIIGGYTKDNTISDKTYVYNIGENAFITIDMPVGLTYTSAVVNNTQDKIYVIGGDTTEESYTNTIYIYDIKNKKWVKDEIMNTLHGGLSKTSAVVNKDLIYVIGGYTKDDYNSDKIYVITDKIYCDKYLSSICSNTQPKECDSCIGEHQSDIRAYSNCEESDFEKWCNKDKY